MRKEFCKGCKLSILIPTAFYEKFGVQEKPVEFEDGWYCYKCAMFKVNKARRK